MRNDAAAGALDERSHALLQLNLHPLEVLQVAHNHLVVEDARFGLAAVDHHGFLVDGGCVILTGASTEACRFALGHAPLVGVKLKQLVCALAHLALFVEHKTAAEDVNFPQVGHRRVTLATLDRLGAAVGDALPNYIVSIDLGSHDFLAYVIIEPPDQEHVVTDRG